MASTFHESRERVVDGVSDGVVELHADLTVPFHAPGLDIVFDGGPSREVHRVSVTVDHALAHVIVLAGDALIDERVHVLGDDTTC